MSKYRKNNVARRVLAMFLATMLAIPSSSITAFAANGGVDPNAVLNQGQLSGENEGETVVETQSDSETEEPDSTEEASTEEAGTENEGATEETTESTECSTEETQSATETEEALTEETLSEETRPEENLVELYSDTIFPVSNAGISSDGENQYVIHFEYEASLLTEGGTAKAVLYGSDDRNLPIEEWEEVDSLTGEVFQTKEEERGEIKTFSFEETCKFRPDKGVVDGYDYYAVVVRETAENAGEPVIIDATDIVYAEQENDSDYEGIAFLDENGQRITKLELHEGESKLVRIALIKKESGEYIPLDNQVHEPNGAVDIKTALLAGNGNWSYTWSVCDYSDEANDLRTEYIYGKDYDLFYSDDVSARSYYDDTTIKLAWTKEYILGISNYITGTGVTPEGEYHYIKYDVRLGNDCLAKGGNHTAVLPVKVIAADGSYGAPENPVKYDSSITKEQEWQAVRDTMVARENKYYGIVMEQGDELPDGTAAYVYDIYDFYDERDDMLPVEGDYLHWSMGDREWITFGEPSEYKDENIAYYNEKYHMYTYPQEFITTAYEEQLVDEKIESLLSTDATLHAAYDKYTSNPDGDNAKTEALQAIYDWIQANVSGNVKGEKESVDNRRTPMYHTVFSTLFINNGYDSKPGSGTCQAFALLFTRLSREFGIPSKVIMGVDPNAHTYNIAQFEDAWYYVDASGSTFKKSYTEFSKADEQSQFAMYYFTKNYTSKIKNYGRNDAVLEIVNKSGEMVYQAANFDEAAQFLVDALEQEQNDNNGNINSEYTIKLIKDFSLFNFGNASYPSYDSFDLQGAYDRYTKYISINLNGHTLTVPKSHVPEEYQTFGGETTFRAKRIYNGKIAIGQYTGVTLDGADFEQPNGEQLYFTGENLTISGLGTLVVSRNMELKDSVNVNGVGELIVKPGVIVAGNINVPKLSFDNSIFIDEGRYIVRHAFGNDITFYGDVTTQYLYTFLYDENEVYKEQDIIFENLIVTKGSKICQGSNFVIRGNINLSGRTYICNENGATGCKNVWSKCIDFYGGIYDPATIKLVRTQGEKIAEGRVVINGIIDASDTEAYYRACVGEQPLTIVPVNSAYEPEEFKLNDTVGTFRNCTYYISRLDSNTGDSNIAASGLTAQKLTIDNVEQLIHIPYSEGEMDLFDDVLQIAGKSITVSTTNEDGTIVNDLRTFTRWDQAATYISTLNNASTHYLISLSEDITARGSLTLPKAAASITFRSTKMSQDNEKEKISIRYVGDLNLTMDVSFEDVELIAQTYNATTGTYTDGYKSVVKLNGKVLSLDSTTMEASTVTGSKGSALVLKNESSIYATKAVSGISALELYSSVLTTEDTISVTGNTLIDSTGEQSGGSNLCARKKINLVNVISNGSKNRIVYGGNTSTDILTISGTISGENTMFRNLDEQEYGPYVKVRTDAIILCPDTYSVVDPVAKKTVTKAFDELTEEEKNHLTIANAPKADASWFVVEEQEDVVPTYKTGNELKYGKLNTNVILYMSSDEGHEYAIESGYSTLAEAFKRIDELAVPSNYYTVEITNSTDLATDTTGATSSKVNPAFPSKLKKLVMTSRNAETVLFFKDTITIKSNVEIENMLLQSSAAATIALGNFELTFRDCKLMDAAGNYAVKCVKGGGSKGASKLILDGTALQTTADISNVGTVFVKNSPMSFGDFRSDLLAGTGMNIGTLEIGASQTVETRGNTILNHVIHDGSGTLIIPATVTKVTRRTATEEVGQVSKITPMLTINGLVNNKAGDALQLKLTQKLTNSEKQYYYEVIDFSEEIEPAAGKMTTALKRAGVWLAKAAGVSADMVVLSADNHAEGGILVKTGGYLAYRECDANVVLSYTDTNGVAVETPFTTLTEAITEINSMKVKRDYVIALTDKATLPERVSNDENALYKAPAALKMPTAAYVNSLTIRPKEDGEDSAKIYFQGAIYFTSNTTLENIAFVRMAKTGTSYNFAEEITEYPAVTNVSAGGYALNLRGNITFNCPINLAGGTKGSISFEDNAAIYTFTAGRVSEKNVIYGMINGFTTLNVTENLSVQKYRTKANAALTGGTLQAENVFVKGDKNPVLTVEGNFTATNTKLDSGDIVIKDVYDGYSKKYAGAKASFKDLTITGADMRSAWSGDKITIRADRDFNISGKLTCSTELAKLVTRQKYHTVVKNRIPYLNISGTVVIEDYGNNNATSLGDRMEVEVLYSNECWDSAYIHAKGIQAETAQDTDAVSLVGAPSNTALVLTTTKGTVDQFRLSPANIPTGRNQNRFDANNTDGYILKKASGKLYAYYGNEVKVAVVKNGGEDGRLDLIPSETVLGYYPTLADAVADVDARKDKNTAYTFILMQDLGVKQAEYEPIVLNLPTYAKEVTITSYATEILTDKKAVFYTNKISLKTTTTFSNVNLDGVVLKNKIANGAALDIATGANNLTLNDVATGGQIAEGVINKEQIGIKNITGNGKNKLTLASDELQISGGVTGFAEVALANGVRTDISGALQTTVLTFASNEKVNVKGTITITDIHNENGTLEYYKNETSRKTNLTIKGHITNSSPANKLKLVLFLAKPTGKITTFETIDNILLAKVNNKVDIATATKLVATIEKAPLDAYTVMVSEDVTKPDCQSRNFDIDAGLLKANRGIYVYDRNSDVGDFSVSLSYVEEGVNHQVICPDMAQAVKEIEAINAPLNSYTITVPGEILDTDVTSDTTPVSAFKLPAAGKASEVIITAEALTPVRYSGNISYAGKLHIRNIIFNPAKVSGANIIPTDTAISSTSAVIKTAGGNQTVQGLTLENVTTLSDVLAKANPANCPVDAKRNPIGLLTKITGTNKVTEVSMKNSDLRIKEGISNVKELHLQSTDLVTGKTSTIGNLYLENAVDGSSSLTHTWKMLGATSVENIYGISNNTYLAAAQTVKGVPNMTLKNRVASGMIYINLLKASSTLLAPQSFEVYENALEGQLALENANLITAKLENTDKFKGYVPGDATDVSDWITYKDKNGYVKTTSGENVKVRIEQYFDSEPENISETYAGGIADAVSIIENMNDKNASYRIYLSTNAKTGAVGTNGTESYAAFSTPTKAKLVTLIGDAYAGNGSYVDDGITDRVTVSYTGALTTKCNIAFENIIFDEGALNSGVFSSNNIVTLTTGNFDMAFDEECGYVRDDAKNSKYGEEALEADLLFGSIQTGTNNASSSGITVEGRKVYCIGDVTMKNVTLSSSTVLSAGGKITISGNTFVKDNSVAEIIPGNGKALALNNVYGNNPSELILHYYYTKNASYPKTTGQLSINGVVEPDGGENTLEVKIRPNLYKNGIDFTPASVYDLADLQVYTTNFAGVTANRKLATIPKAATESIQVQFYNGSAWVDLDSSYHVGKHNKGFYIIGMNPVVSVEGFRDEGYTRKIYESTFTSLVDAVTDIENLGNTGICYRLTLSEMEYNGGVEGLGITKLPTKAKEITIKGEAGRDMLVFFTGKKLTLGCNTVLEGIVLQGGATKADVPIYTSNAYDITLGKYSLTEINAPSGIKTYRDGYPLDINQNGIRGTIMGGAGSSYTLKYTNPALVERDGYLDILADNISGITNVRFENEVEVGNNHEETHKPVCITVNKAIKNVTNLSVESNCPMEASTKEHMRLVVNGSVTTTNGKLKNATLFGNDVTISKKTTLEKAKIKAGSSKIGDGKIKLTDVILADGYNIIDGKQNKDGKSLLEITGTISKTYDGEQRAIEVGLRYCDDSNYAKLGNNFLLLTAKQVMPDWFVPMYDSENEKFMGPKERWNAGGYGLYKEGSSILFGKSSH